MPETTAIRASSLSHMVVSTKQGTTLQDAFKDALVAAIQTGVDVVLVHNDKRYEINMEPLLRLIAVQSPLVTGKHLVRGGP